VAFHHLVTTLRQHDYTLIDCQVYNDHLGTFGARTIDRSDFLDELALCLEKPIIKGSWKDLAR
ncbi:MAG: hypothetical protein JNM00_10230, partial [Flavobacteriales bacterium]|nr:hypothetical protein [Flavobacteriales bacterium]